MNLLIESALVFFGTLLVAGLVALGEPVSATRALSIHVPEVNAVAPLFDMAWPQRVTALQP